MPAPTTNLDKMMDTWETAQKIHQEGPLDKMMDMVEAHKAVPRTTISAAPSGVGQTLQHLYDTLLQGMQDRGSTAREAEILGGPVLGPLKALSGLAHLKEALSQAVSGSKAPVGEEVAHGFNQMVGGGMQAAGPFMMLSPEAIPAVGAFGAGQAAIDALAKKLPIHPVYQQALSNIAALGLGGVAGGALKGKFGPSQFSGGEPDPALAHTGAEFPTGDQVEGNARAPLAAPTGSKLPPNPVGSNIGPASPLVMPTEETKFGMGGAAVSGGPSPEASGTLQQPLEAKIAATGATPPPLPTKLGLLELPQATALGPAKDLSQRLQQGRAELVHSAFQLAQLHKQDLDRLQKRLDLHQTAQELGHTRGLLSDDKLALLKRQQERLQWNHDRALAKGVRFSTPEEAQQLRDKVAFVHFNAKQHADYLRGVLADWDEAHALRDRLVGAAGAKRKIGQLNTKLKSIDSLIAHPLTPKEDLPNLRAQRTTVEQSIASLGEEANRPPLTQEEQLGLHQRLGDYVPPRQPYLLHNSTTGRRFSIWSQEKIDAIKDPVQKAKAQLLRDKGLQFNQEYQARIDQEQDPGQKAGMQAEFDAKLKNKAIWQERLVNIPKRIGQYIGAASTPEHAPFFNPEGALKDLSQKQAQIIWGKNLNHVPTKFEIGQKISQFDRQANYAGGILGTLDRLKGTGLKTTNKTLEAELASPSPKGTTLGMGLGAAQEFLEKPKKFSTQDMVMRSQKAGFRVHDLTKNESAPIGSFISPDGTRAVSGFDVHERAAQHLYGGTGHAALDKLMDHGWVRKIVNGSYQVNELNSKTLPVIEDDLFRSAPEIQADTAGGLPHHVYIDLGHDSDNFIKVDSKDLFENHGGNLRDAIKAGGQHIKPGVTLDFLGTQQLYQHLSKTLGHSQIPATPAGESYLSTQEAARPKEPTFLDKASKLWPFIKEQFGGYMQPLIEAERRAKGGRPIGAGSPSKVALLAKGSAQGLTSLVDYHLGSIKSEAERAGLGRNLTHYLNLTAMERDLDNAVRLNKTDTQVLPAGWTSQRVNADRLQLEQHLGPQQYAHVELMAHKIFDLIGTNALDLPHDSGLMSDKNYQEYKRRGPEYIPSNRQFPGVLSRMGTPHTLNIGTHKVEIPFEGSNLVTQDPWEATRDLLHRSVWEAKANQAASTLVDFAKVHPESGIDIQPQGKHIPPGYEHVPVMRDGKAEHYVMPEEFASILKFSDPQTFNIAAQVFKGWKRAWQAAVTTSNIGFSSVFTLSHYGTMGTLSGARDYLDPAHQTKLAAQWTHTLLHDVLPKSPEWEEFVKRGAAFGDLTHEMEFGLNTRKGVPDVSWKKQLLNKNFPYAHPFRMVARITGSIEETTKMTHEKRLLSQGMDPTEAAYQTLMYGGAPNYGYGSRVSLTHLNNWFPFYNAHMRYLHQGWELFTRNMKGNPHDLYNPKFLGKSLATITMLELGLSAWNARFKNPDDGRPEMEHINPYTKENSAIILTPMLEQTPQGGLRHIGIPIPIPSAMRPVHAAIQAGLNALFTPKEERSPMRSLTEAFSGVAPIHTALYRGDFPDMALRSLSSASAPPIGTGIDLLRGIESYTGNEIEPRAKAEEEPQFRSFGSTLPLFTHLAGAFPNAPLISHPAETQYAVRRGLGTVSLDMAEALSNLLYKKGPQPPEGKLSQLSQVPFSGDLLRRFLTVGGSDQVVQNLEDSFYTRIGEKNMKSRTLSDVEQTNPQLYLKLMADPTYQDAKNVSDVGRIVNKNLANLRWAENMLIAHPEMTTPQSRAQVFNNLFKERESTLVLANQILDSISKTELPEQKPKTKSHIDSIMDLIEGHQLFQPKED